MPRFFQGYDWRWAVFSITNPIAPELVLVTFLSGITFDWSIDRVLNDPAVASVRVPSDSPEVNLLYDDEGTSYDDDPLLAEGRRVLIGFRREAQGTGVPWVPRFAGIVMQPRDAAENGQGAGNAYTTAVAYDQWQLLYKRPVVSLAGDLPTSGTPLHFVGPADVIATNLLAYSVAYYGPAMIQFGTVEDLPEVVGGFDCELGLSVGDAWKRLCDAGYMDIVVDPIYEPGAGEISRVSIYARAGSDRPEAVFSWDKPGRAVAGISRVEDGTLRANNVQAYIGEAGPPVALQSDSLSESKYGRYFVQTSYPDILLGSDVVAKAAEDLQLRKDGVTTINMTPVPEWAPIPLVDYDIGDTVPIHASRNLRKKINGTWRISRIPLRGSTSQTETVESLEAVNDV